MEPENQYQKNADLNKEIRKDAFQLLVAIFFIATLIAGGGVLQKQRLAEASANNGIQSSGQNVAAATAATTGAVDLLGIFKKAEECLDTGAQSCRNKCATTYVDVSGGSMRTTDCYVSQDPNGPQVVVSKLHRCIEENTRYSQNASKSQVEFNKKWLETEDALKNALCITNSKVTFSEDTFEFGVANSTQVTVTVPKECTEELDAVLKLREEASVQPSATREQRNACANRGPVVCYPADFLNPLSDYKCMYKEAVQNGQFPVGINGGIPASNASNQVGQANPSCKNGTIGQRAQCQVAKLWDKRISWSAGLAIGQSIGQGLSGLLFGSNSDISNQDGAANNTALACNIAANKITVASGEEVTIRWQTENARLVAITGVGTSVPSSSQATVKPVQTTTYTLTATGVDNKTKKCTTTVTVDGNGSNGAVGVAPPQLACTPNPIAKGTESTIRWSCTTDADRSEGSGIETGGAPVGSATVSPTFNAEYGVTCFKNDVAIGKNVCSVAVGESLYDIIVYPAEAKRGERVRISWSGLFMNSCRVRGPRGFDYTNTQGVVTTEPFVTSESTVSDQNLRTAVYTLECQTQFGATVTKDASVKLIVE